MKIRKTYSSFYNGISEQTDELILDTQCRDMVNCVPDIVKGLSRRNGMRFVAENTDTITTSVFHNYDKSLYGESYLFVKKASTTEPFSIFNKSGIKQTLTFDSNTLPYLNIGIKNYRALTIQDTTFIINRDAKTGYEQDLRPEANYIAKAYLWAKRSSNDYNNQYTYGIYVNGYRCWTSHHKADIALVRLKQLIDGTVVPGTAKTEWATGYTGTGDDTITAYGGTVGDANKQDVIFLTEGKDSGFPTGLVCTVKGTVLEISAPGVFTFSSWDSWGNQASKGWNKSVNKLSDLPSDIEFDSVYVKITGADNDNNTDYYVKWNGSSWEETRDPEDVRSTYLNMPVKVTREANGTFKCSIIEWDIPTCGNIENNKTPSFIGKQLQDIFFFKNRLGLVADDSVVLSETASYYNFYSTTVLEVLDTDPIDIAIASKQANLIKFSVPFKDSVYLFCEDSQYELKSDGALSPLTVSITYVGSFSTGSAYPVQSADSLYFVSTDKQSNQLREFLKTEQTLELQGQDLTIAIPTTLPRITKLVTSSTLGYIICYSKDNPEWLYVFYRKLNNREVLQASWFKWKLSVDIDDVLIIDNKLYMTYKRDGYNILSTMALTPNLFNDKVDEVRKDSFIPFSSYLELPIWYISDGNSRITTENIIVQKATVTGSGKWDVDIIREDYNKTIKKTAGYINPEVGYIIPSSVQDNDVFISSKNTKYRLRFSNSASIGTMYKFYEDRAQNVIAFKHPTLDAGYKYYFDSDGNLTQTVKFGTATIPEQEDWRFVGVYSGSGDFGTETTITVPKTEIVTISNVQLGRDYALEAQYNNDLAALNPPPQPISVRKYWTRVTELGNAGGRTRWYNSSGTQVRDDRWGVWASQYSLGTINQTINGTGEGYDNGISGIYDNQWNAATSSYVSVGNPYTVYPYDTVLEYPPVTNDVGKIVVYNLGSSPQASQMAAAGISIPNHGLTYKYNSRGALLTVDVWNSTVYGQSSVRTVDVTNKVGGYYVPAYTYTFTGTKTTTTTSKDKNNDYSDYFYSISFQGNGTGETVWFDAYGTNVTDFILPNLVDGKAVYDPGGGHEAGHRWGSGIVGAWVRYPAEETVTTVKVPKYVAYSNDSSLEEKVLIAKYFTREDNGGGKTEHYDNVEIIYEPETGTTYDFTNAILVRKDTWGSQEDLEFHSYLSNTVKYVLNANYSVQEFPITYNDQFKITAITLEGLYRPRTKGTK